MQPHLSREKNATPEQSQWEPVESDGCHRQTSWCHRNSVLAPDWLQKVQSETNVSHECLLEVQQRHLCATGHQTSGGPPVTTGWVPWTPVNPWPNTHRASRYVCCVPPNRAIHAHMLSSWWRRFMHANFRVENHTSPTLSLQWNRGATSTDSRWNVEERHEQTRIENRLPSPKHLHPPENNILVGALPLWETQRQDTSTPKGTKTWWDPKLL